MAQYVYKNPEKEEYVEVTQKMDEVHEFIDGNGLKWIRVWTTPQTCIDSKWSIWDSKDFAEKSGKKKGSYGDILDKSAELSAARAEKDGVDKVKEGYFENYQRRVRKEHPAKTKERIDNLVIEV